MAEVVVSDTSPLQYLHQVGCLSLLPSLFGRVLIPPAVDHEIQVGIERGNDLPVLGLFPWVVVEPPREIPAFSVELQSDRGEREALALALEHGCRVLMDDRDERRAADALGIAYTGTLGVLISAKRSGLVDSPDPGSIARPGLSFVGSGSTGGLGIGWGSSPVTDCFQVTWDR